MRAPCKRTTVFRKVMGNGKRAEGKLKKPPIGGFFIWSRQALRV